MKYLLGWANTMLCIPTVTFLALDFDISGGEKTWVWTQFEPELNLNLGSGSRFSKCPNLNRSSGSGFRKKSHWTFPSLLGSATANWSPAEQRSWLQGYFPDVNLGATCLGQTRLVLEICFLYLIQTCLIVLITECDTCQFCHCTMRIIMYLSITPIISLVLSEVL